MFYDKIAIQFGGKSMIENIEGTTINIRIQDEEIALPNEIKRKIEEFWNKCKTENHYLYDERIGLSKEYACSSLVAGCLIETSDNYYIVGELADNTSFPHCMQISGGSADNNDIKDGKIDIFNTIIRECKEELNINLQDKKMVENFHINYICLPKEKVHTYILYAKAQLNMNKLQMQEYYEKYLEYLKENNLEIEFGKLHFIKKGKTTEELEKFTNPKRDYLKNLLEMDSQHSRKSSEIQDR